MKEKQNCRCDACGCAFVPEPKTQREGEIEYSFFNCDYCGKAYIVSVTDAALHRNNRTYAADVFASWTTGRKIKSAPRAVRFQHYFTDSFTALSTSMILQITPLSSMALTVRVSLAVMPL